MVRTRSSVAGVAKDDNRIIAVVTGANSGIGQGICNQLLRALSFPPGSHIPASTPQASALPPSLQTLLEQQDDPFEDDKVVPSDPPPTLTLILACRSKSNGHRAESEILNLHEQELKEREEQGLPVRKGWKEGLKIVTETVDLDSVGGDNGVLSFCERLKDRYPHITSLFLNAGVACFTHNDYVALSKQVILDGPNFALSHPQFSSEERDAMSADGERGKVWGVNVLANYIMVKELEPLLRLSPTGLPFPPRVVLTSSATAWYSTLELDKIDDIELVSWKKKYSPSKYIGDIMMCQFDKELGSESTGENKQRPIRCLVAEPGCVRTNITGNIFGTMAVWVAIMRWFYLVSFQLLRVVFGSPWHPIDATDAAIGPIYAALVDEKYLLPPGKVPGPKFSSTSHRWTPSTVTYAEVDRWEETEGYAQLQMRHCESIRLTWRRKMGLE